MTKNVRMLRSCLPTCCLLASLSVVPGLASDDAAADPLPAEVLVVGPGDAIAVEAPEPETTIEAGWNGGLLTPVDAPAGHPTAPRDGSHWLALASRDAAGNLSPVRWIRLRVDDRPPVVELRFEPRPADDDGGRLWLPPDAEVVAGAQDPLAGVARLWVDLGGTRRDTRDGELRVPLPDDAGDSITIRAGAADRVGNETPEHRVELYLDRRPPKLGIRVRGERVEEDAKPILGPEATLELETDDPESGLQEVVTHRDGETVERPTWQGPWPAGEHVATARASDRVGHAATVELRFTVDAQGPAIRWRVADKGARGDDGVTYYRPPVTLQVSAEDALAGLAELRAAADGEGYAPLAEGTRVVDGDHLRIEAIDRVGNRDATRAHWAIDVEPPRVVLRAPDGMVLEPGTRHRLRRGDELEVEILDASGIDQARYRLNRLAVPGRRPPAPLETPARLVLERRGRHLLTVDARDRLGWSRTVRWRLDVGAGDGR